MENSKQQALENLKDFLKNTPKSAILEQLNFIAQKTSSGIKISDILDGCFDDSPYFAATDINELAYVVTERGSIDKITECISPHVNHPIGYIIDNNIQNPHKNAGFLFMFVL